MDKAARPQVPTPRVNVTVTIRPGAPPKDLCDLPGGAVLPDDVPAKLAKVEARLMKHLSANPKDRARFLSDPIGVLRTVAPDDHDLHAALSAAREASGSILPDVPDAELGTMKVNVAKPTRKPPRTKGNGAKGA